MSASVIITAFREQKTICKAIESIAESSKISGLEVIVVSPDSETIKAAEKCTAKYNDRDRKIRFLILKDDGKGKPAALNMAVQKAQGEILVFTDGDMYVDSKAISNILPYFEDKSVGGVSGHIVSLDSKDTLFGYFSHVFCEAAHQKRLKGGFTPMSGYLYAIRNIKRIFPINENLRAEDAYISHKILQMGYKIKYAKDSLAYVHFPKNLNDWLNQKTRSLGGNIQAASYFKTNPSKSLTIKPPSQSALYKKNLETATPGEIFRQEQSSLRGITQDLKMFFFPIVFAKSTKEFLFSLILYPLRLYLWIRIYFQHFTNSYSKGAWKRIESSKVHG
ncbi:hypothetical protein A2982_03105 [candidate division WWE3 bacterium RIFCSPLOWO2_01_FULL_39_13]|uniref:Glycosyltransferase 2-like domain-containing protein n=1 Tax=candidate division WWE3 bacterium RIFCSPLOWO2_01_FULL_39_13 TaxID=1802624 RepID=A0A1F4V1W0_UNCKA|nr:MAG: hypothetical protein A2982_03105 [candidate division WWE3 bacterium RIFCSPLOWO2_01_FULL_39_13]